MSRKDVPLRLTALDAGDLDAISAALQDAVAQLGDFEFTPRQRNFTIAFNRFRWEAGAGKQRIRTGLQIGQVLAARSRNLRREAGDAVVNLLSITFEPGEAPSGDIVLVFSGDGELRLRVECIDLVMADLSHPWPATGRPAHALDPS